jgi:hypothetical protein
MESWSGFAALAVIGVTILVFRILDHCWQVERDREFERKQGGER